MTERTTIPLQQTAGERVRKVFRRFFLALVILVMTGVIATFIVINVPPLRQWLVKTVIAAVNARMDAKVEFDDFSGSLLSDLTLSGVRVIAAGDTILTMHDLTLLYDLEFLLARKIVLSRLDLHHPQVRIVRSMDSSWNIARLFARNDSTTQHPPFRWRVEVREFSIQQGTAYIFDSLASLHSTVSVAAPRLLTSQLNNISFDSLAQRFTLSCAEFDSIQCSLSANLNFRTNEHTVSLRRLAFHERISGVALKSLSLFAFTSASRTELSNVRLKTEESQARLRLIAENANLLALLAQPPLYEEWSKLSLQCALHIDSLSFQDVQRFTPAFDGFRDKVAMRLDVYGSLPRLTLKTFEVKGVRADDPSGLYGKLAPTFISFDGAIHIPAFGLPELRSRTRFDVRLNPMRCSYSDLRRYAPGIPVVARLVHLGEAGVFSLERGFVKGTPEALETYAKLNTSGAGGYEIEARVDTRPDTIQYDAALILRNANLAALFGNHALQSNLNARAHLYGQGLSLHDATATLMLDADHSDIAGRSFDALALTAFVRDGGIINLQHAHLRWNRPADFVVEDNDDDDNNYHRGADLWINGTLNLRQAQSPQYRLEARASHLDLYRLTLFPGSNTDASFTMNIIGSGFSADSMSGNLHIHAPDFRTPKRAFDPFSINARLEHRPHPDNPAYREFHLQSELAEAHLRGDFTMPAFISSFANEVDNTIFAVRRKYHQVRDSILASTYEGLFIPKPETARTLNVDFSLIPYDIEISRLFSGFVKIQCRGELHGRMRGTTQNYTFYVDSSLFREFYYTDDATSVEIAHGRLQGVFEHRTQGDSLNLVAAEAFVRMDSLFRLDDFIFRHANGRAHYTGDTFDFTVQSVYGDSTLAFYTKALLDMSRRDSELTLDTAWVLYRGDMEWSTVGKMSAILNKEGLLIEQLALKRPRAETAYLSGQVWFDHYSNAQLIVESMPLQDFNRLLPPENRIPTLDPLYGTLERMQLSLSGTPANPHMNLLLNASNVYYNKTYLGALAVNASHQDSTVKGTAEIQNPRLFGDDGNARITDSLKTLTVVAKSFPLNLAFVPVEERLVSGKPIDIRFDASDLPLGALNIFVPGITNLQGNGDAHFTISGSTPDNIVYRGEARIPRASFIFEANNIKYFAEGRASLLNRTVTIEHLNLANDPLDYPKGRASATGTITVNGFDITGFDITAQIPSQGLFVLGNASRIPQPQLFGDVIVATGENPFHFYGSLEAPYLRGDVNVIEAKVAFPEIRSVKSENRLFCFETIVKDGTGRTITARDCNQQEYTLLVQRDSTLQSLASGIGSEAPPYLEPKQLSADELAALAAEHAIWKQQQNDAHADSSHLPHSWNGNGSGALTEQQALDREKIDRKKAEAEYTQSPESFSNDINKQTTSAPLSFAEKIDYGLNVKLLGNFSVTMDWGPLEQLVANLAQENPEQPLRYVKTPDRPQEHRLFGDLILREGSTYKYYRIFNASGKVAFNTGTMSNPRLAINAVLRGQRTQPDRSGTSEYLVNLGITGTKKTPTLKMSYLVDNIPGVGDSVKIQNDAIMLLLFGRTQDEFATAVGSSVSDVITQNSSSLASRLLTDLLQGTGVVRSADIFFAGGRGGAPLDLQQARVQVTGEISNLGVLWQVANDIGTNTPNTSFSIDIPFRTFLDQELFKNIVLQITRSAVTANSSVFMRQQREWEVKIGSRNSW